MLLLMRFDVWAKTLLFINNFLMEGNFNIYRKNIQTFSVLVEPNQKGNNYLFG